MTLIVSGMYPEVEWLDHIGAILYFFEEHPY
jgi:hypothetical protein